MSGSNYIRQVSSAGSVKVQIVVPKNFLTTDRLQKNKSRFMQDIQREAYDFWVTEVSRKLNKTRDRYLDNLFVKKTGDKNIVFELKGPAKFVEKGWKPFDMKPGFAKSDKLNTKPFKIPADKRSEFVKGRKSAPKMIIPIDPSKGIFRTFSMNQMGTSMWENSGYAGAQIIPSVKEHLKKEIIPKYVGKYVREAFSK